MNGFWYDPIAHRYYYFGKPIPSVTQALIHGGEIETKWYADGAADRGRQVHAFTEVFDLRRKKRTAEIGTPQWLAQLLKQADLDGISGECDAYVKFVRDHAPIYTGIEQPGLHKTLRYGGRADRNVGVLFGLPGRLEIKTGQPAHWHGLQLSGYQRMDPRGCRWVLYLRGNGTFKIVRLTRADDDRDFLRALQETWKVWPQQLAHGA